MAQELLPAAPAIVPAATRTAWLTAVRSLALLSLVAGAAFGQELWRAETGPPPIAIREPGITPTAPVQPRAPGTWFDTTNRAAIQSAYLNTLKPTVGVPMGWTGSVSGNNPGTTSQAYRDAALTRVNWFRALAGVAPDITFDSTYIVKAQKAALMFVSNQQLSHSPPASWLNWSADGAEAAAKSNICLNFNSSLANDPGCVQQYMTDDGLSNTGVGHRRWLLYPQTQLMGTGDAESGGYSGNALWVQDSHIFDARPATRDNFVAWPPPGYVPYQVIPARWSISLKGASFFNATVTMKRGTTNIPVTLLPVEPAPPYFIGEPTLAWVPTNPLPSPLTSDTSITVTVSNISGAGPFTYTVTAFDPTAGGSLQAPVLVSPANGATSVPGSGALLTWNASAGATSYDVYFGATNPPPLVTNTVNVSYSPGNLSVGFYYWRIVARSGSATAESATWSFSATGSGSSGLQFVPVSPCRVIDTRAGQGTSGAFGPPSMGTGATRVFPIPQGRCGIPSSALAYSVNVTVVPTGILGYLSLWPDGVTQPLVSTLNAPRGGIVANAAIVPAGNDGAIDLYVTDPADVIVDINGYFTTSTSYLFYATTPCRIADTRNAAGTFGGPVIAGGQSRSFPVPTSPCGVPSSARAYSLNATVVPSGPLGYLTLWPTGQTQPFVSTLNSPDGRIVANAALLPAGSSNGAVSTFVTDTTHVILDVNGYFAPPGGTGALNFYSATPCRVMDTRNATGTFGGPVMPAGGVRAVPVPSSPCGIPANAKAYSMNVTVVPQEPLGYLTVWPTGGSQPNVSTLNSPDGRIVANAAIVPADASGSISVYVTSRTHVILDVNGYFAP